MNDAVAMAQARLIIWLFLPRIVFLAQDTPPAFSRQAANKGSCAVCSGYRWICIKLSTLRPCLLAHTRHVELDNSRNLGEIMRTDSERC